MYVVKSVLVKVTIALLAGLAGAIGTRLGYAIWDNGLGDKVKEDTSKSFS